MNQNLDDKTRNEIQELVNAEVFNKPEIQYVENSESKSKSIVAELHDAAVVATVKNDVEVQKKFSDQAKKSVNTELNTIDQEIKTRQQSATYNANEEACKNYGIDKHVPLWQITLMKIGSGFWFVVYWIFASFTIAPLNVFFKGIKTFIKNSYVVFIFALIAYLAIVIGIPLLINFFG